MVFKIDRTKIHTAVKLALADTVSAADLAFTKAIESKQYDWPNKTQRQNGTLAGSPRDIVDLGNLRDLQVYGRISDFSYQFTWGVNYAALNHEGGVTERGKFHPSRPWTCYAIKGDNSAPLRYQRPGAELDVPFYFGKQFKLYARSY